MSDTITTVLFAPDGSVRLARAASPAPGPGEVVVDVRFAGINPTDTYQRRRVVESGVELDRVPGVEVAGVVSAVGGAGSRWKIGDRVFGLVHDGGLRQRVLAHADLLAPIPHDLTLREAAAIPEVFTTAYDAIQQGELAADETLLVSGATGSVGLAALQLGRARGAAVIGVCRSDAGRARLESLGFEAHVRNVADAESPYRERADVVIELVGGVNARDDLAALRPRGRMVFIAAQGDEDVTFNLREFKTKRAVMIGSTLRRRGFAAKVEAVRAFERDVVPLLASRAVTPTIAAVFPAAEAQAAFDYMATPGKSGKVLVEFG